MEIHHIINSNDSGFYFMANKNRKLRAQIIQTLQSIKDGREKLDWLHKFFLNGYDYDYCGVFQSTPSCRDFQIGCLNFRTHAFAQHVPYYEHSLSPSVHMIKMGQCTVYAREVKELLEASGLKAPVTLQRDCPCFNKYSGKLHAISHVFNAVTLDGGRRVNFDACSAIMARDAQAQNCDINYKSLEQLNTWL